MYYKQIRLLSIPLILHGHPFVSAFIDTRGEAASILLLLKRHLHEKRAEPVTCYQLEDKLRTDPDDA
ncbi:hypothetical protein GCM10011585_00370 [Edaphobacter dinghuensis]|uniref:Uncharacterized protein n=1 Tax=Edaphobacter dinghuensis TaxID=1560005 RepID=A0A917LWT2_9BACT|nr:hypothetical protein GCM10011585_00370 [Edaphobacter dinghuensis]